MYFLLFLLVWVVADAADYSVRFNGAMPASFQSNDINLHKFMVDTQNHTREYLCAMQDEQEHLAIESEPAHLDLEVLLEVFDRAVRQIQKSLSTDHCLFAYELNGNYWTYAYCYGDKIIQYHEGVPANMRSKVHVPHSPNYIYVLGRQLNHSDNSIEFRNQAQGTGYTLNKSELAVAYDEFSPFVAETSPQMTQRVIRHRIGSGEICDLTNEPRSVEVIYKCDDNSKRRAAQIVAVNEVTTCQYQMIVMVPKLCQVEEFKPRSLSHERQVEIECKEVKEGAADGDFFLFSDESPLLDAPFPIKPDHKMAIDTLNLFPIGNGFYVGLQKTTPQSVNEYYNSRHVLIFNGLYDSLNHLGLMVGKVFSNALERTIMAPIFDSNDQQRVLCWNDTFSMYFELYGFNGELISLVNINRNGTLAERSLMYLLVDIATWTDLDGDSFLPPDLDSFEAPKGAWNFEYFTPFKQTETVSELPLDSNQVTYTQTVTVSLDHDEL